MRAQASLELLLLVLAFLAFFAVWFPLISLLENAARQSVSFNEARLALSDLKGAAESACIMGGGSFQKSVVRVPENSVFSASGNALHLSFSTGSRQFELEETVSCKLKSFVLDASRETEFEVENEKGTISVRVH